MTVVYHSSIYPSGDDTMFHLYRGDVLYQSIQSGNWYPLLDPTWYNGVELLRYWAPLPVYFQVLCQVIAGGSMMDGYLVFLGMITFFGGVSWLLLGSLRNRLGLGAFLGALWFFMPNNLYAIFVEGNLPRAICMVILPWFVHYLDRYLRENRWTALPKLMLCTLLLVLCHLGYAGMIFLATVVYLLLYSVLYHRFRPAVHCVIAIALGFLLVGIWIIPSLQGGIVSTDSSQVMASFFQNAWVSINPWHRISAGQDDFYFGMAAFLLCIFGVLFGRRNSLPGFANGLMIFLCTTTMMYPVLSRLPGSQYLWMLRFISIALCFALFGFLNWDTLKKPFVVLFCVLLVLDTFPSLPLLYGNMEGTPVEERLQARSEETLITAAKELTKQRLALMDLSSLNAMGAYLSSGYGTKTKITFGAGWQGANTAARVVQLNQALEDGRYLYLFDRCLELGNDTVLVRTSKLQNGAYDEEALDEAAERNGYALAESNQEYRLYHYDTPYETFGTRTEYPAIGIGSQVAEFSLVYPSMAEASSPCLNEYTFEELSGYRTIYLAGFTYTNKKEAEQLILRLSSSGVRVVIAADGIPIDEYTGIQEFLGVRCYSLSFYNGYPLLYTTKGVLNPDLFPSGYTNWKTVYLEGLEQCFGYVEEGTVRMEFYGTVKNENLVFLGLNIPYHCSLTSDRATLSLLSDALQLSYEELPARTVVPLTVFYSGNTIRIHSEEDRVNTTLAFHDAMESEETFFRENALLYVNAGDTTLTLHYPYLVPGALVSAAGLLAAIFFLKWTRDYIRYQAEQEKKKGETDEMLEREYQFKFFLNMSHSMVFDGTLGQKHSHTWEISMKIKSNAEEMLPFNQIEHTVEEFISRYQDTYLNEISPFDKVNPILENVCDYFKEQIEAKLISNGWSLIRIEISETPTRTYVIGQEGQPEAAENPSADRMTEPVPMPVTSEPKLPAVEQEAAAAVEQEAAAASEQEPTEPLPRNAEPETRRLKKTQYSTKISVILPVKKKKNREGR